MSAKTRWHREPVPAAPFLAWVDRRLEQLAVHFGAPIEKELQGGHGAIGSPMTTLCVELGWTFEIGSKYISRLRYSRTGMAERARIEDALHHAGVGWWEVYPADEVGDERWCRRCGEPVAVIKIACCWCGSFTASLPAEREAVAA